MGMKISGNAGRVLFCCQSWLRSRSLLFVWFYVWSFPAAYCPELAEVGVQCPLKCPAHFAVQIHPGGGGQVLMFCFFSPVVITWTFFFWIALAVPEGVCVLLTVVCAAAVCCLFGFFLEFSSSILSGSTQSPNSVRHAWAVKKLPARQTRQKCFKIARIRTVNPSFRTEFGAHLDRPVYLGKRMQKSFSGDLEK